MNTYTIYITDLVTGSVETVVYEVTERELNDVREEYELMYPASDGFHLTVEED